MKRFLFVLFLTILSFSAFAQVRQSGNVTPTHATAWTSTGTVQDAGSETNPFITTFGILNGTGTGLCVQSAPSTTAGYQRFCLGTTTSGGAMLSTQNFGTAPAQGISFLINGTAAGLPIVTLPTVSGDLAAFNNTTGTLIDSGVSQSALVLTTNDNGWSGSQYFGSGRPWCDVRAPGGNKAIGAKGDGSTDDTAAFQACVTTVEAFVSSGTVYIPASANSYCIKTGPIVLNNPNTRIIGETRDVQLNACNTDVSILKLTNNQQEAQNLFLVGHGGGDGATGFSFTKSTLILDQNCVDCYIAHLQVTGGLHAIQWNSGEARAFDVIANNSYGSAILYFAAISGGSGGQVAAGWLQNIKPDQTEYPFGVPAAGTTYGAWTNAHLYSSVGTVVSTTCQDGNSYFIQLKTAGTSGAVAPTCKVYGQDMSDNTATWQLAFPNPYYHYQIDSGTNEVFLHDSDTGGGTAGVAMTNTVGGGVAPKSFRGVNLNGGTGYQANFWGHDGSDFYAVNINTNSCISAGCGNYRFDNNFTGLVNVHGGNCSNSPFCVVLGGTGADYTFAELNGENLTSNVANIGGGNTNVAISGTWTGSTSLSGAGATGSVYFRRNCGLLLGGATGGNLGCGTTNVLTGYYLNGNAIPWTASSPLSLNTTTGVLTLSLTPTTCTNQVITAISAVGVGTCASVGNAFLTNSSVTYGTTTVALGASSTSIAGLTELSLTSASGATVDWNSDTYFGRSGAAALRLGQTDNASPVSQKLGVQNVVAGTSNTSGVDWTIAGSQGTGTGAGGNIKFQVAPAGTTGTSVNSLADTMQIYNTQRVNIGGNFAPDATFVINANTGTTSVAAQAGTLQHFVAADGATLFVQFDTFNNNTSLFSGRMSGGNRSSPSAAGAASPIILINGNGYDGVSAFGAVGDIGVLTLNATSTTDHSGQLRFRTVASGATGAPVQRMLIQQGVIVGNGSTDPGANNLIVGGTLTVSGITTDATHTDATVCEDTTTHQFYFGSGAAGICLGTSSLRFKHDVAPLRAGLDQIMALEPVSYRLNPDRGDPDQILYGFTAEQGEGALPDLVHRDTEGRPNTFDYMGVVPVLVKAVQQLKADNDNLRREIDALKIGARQ